MSMELTKIDKENRLVSGWASLDNPDLQGDVVLAEASQRAFEKFRGNIREMHKNEAVGRMVAFKPDTYYDSETGQAYKGIYVTAYISKGAPLTWEKVLDGTLSAFSIKGPIRDSHMDFSKGDRPLRVVKDYDLDELSLVDSGGNQLANVVSITKVNGVTEVTGMIAETEFDNIFWCDKDRVAKISSEDQETCYEGHKMVRAGWTEKDGRSDLEKIQSVLGDYLKKGDSEQGTPANDEGGVNVADKKDETVEPGTAAPAEVDAVEQGKPENEAEAAVEPAAEVEEVEAVEKAADVPEVEADADLEKALGELETKIKDGVEKNSSAIADLIKDIDKRFAERDSHIEKKLGELAEKQDGLSKSLESLAEGLEKMTKSVGSLERETALKKSGDLGGLQEEEGTLEKSGSGVWSGDIFA
jgi:hypothetical protein